MPEFWEPSQRDWVNYAFCRYRLFSFDPRRMRNGRGSVLITGPKMKVYAHAVEFVAEKQTFNRRAPMPERGAVTNYSPRSRSRLLRLLTKIQTGAYDLPIFASLTYHDNWEERGRERRKKNGELTGKSGWKTDLDTFTKRLKRMCPGVQYVWRMETQRRGAPHFHLIIFPPIGAPIEERKVGEAWHEIVDPGNAAHYAVNTNEKAVARVEELKSFRKVFAYVSKYVAKKDEHTAASSRVEELLGRRWGRSRDLNTTPVMSFDLTQTGEVELKRATRKLLKARARRHNTQSRYCRNVVVGIGSHVFNAEDAESPLARLAFDMLWEEAQPGADYG